MYNFKDLECNLKKKKKETDLYHIQSVASSILGEALFVCDLI